MLHVTSASDIMPAGPGRKPKSATRALRARVSAHRERLRAQGLRPIQIWVPDVHAPGFAKEALRQARRAARSRFATEDQAFVDSISDFDPA
jgi:hypothetical protein